MAGKFKTLVDMIDNSLRLYGPSDVFGTKTGGEYQWVTYTEFGVQIEQFRSALASCGVMQGDRVAIIANNRVEWAVACYATYQLGAAFAPMYESQSPKDWDHILNDAQPTVLIVSKSDLFEKALPIAKGVSSIQNLVLLDTKVEEAFSYSEMMEKGRANPVPVAQVDPASMAGLIYTSGTTGKPKGVMLSHANVISNINAIHAIFPWVPGDRSLSFLPWAHSFGQTVELHGLISCGGALGLAERVDTIIQNLSEVKPTLLFSVPRIFNKIYDGINKKMASEGGLKKTLFEAGMANGRKLRGLEGQGRTPGLTGVMNRFYDRLVFSKVRERLGGDLKYAFSGGAALSKEVAEFIDNLNITVYEGYGLSETSPIMTANYPGTRRIGSVGKPIPGVTVRIDTSADSSDPDVGEIINYGPNTMMGYYNRDEETAKVLTEDHGFRTGDLGRFDADGFLYITGRVKEQYKLENGKYVVPAPLEEQLQLSPYILQVMIQGQNKPFNVALIVPDLDSVRAWANEHGISPDPVALCQHQEVRKLIQGEIDRYSETWKRFERPRSFTLLPDEWTVANNMLTPKLSLKRRNVEQRFKPEIEKSYQH